MRDTYPETAGSVLSLRSHRDPAVRRMVVAMLPTLASYNTPAFKELLLPRRWPEERDYALISIGHTATAVGADMKPFLESVMSHIKARLKEMAVAAGKEGAERERGERAAGVRAPAPPDPLFAALGLLAAAVGPTLTMLLHDHLHLLFAAGLSEGLRACLGQVARSIPLLLGVVLGAYYVVLLLFSPGNPGRTTQLSLRPSPHRSTGPNGTSGTTVNQGYGYAGAGMPPSKELLTLALNTLGTFDFSGHTLTEFVQTNALPYVEDDSPENSHRSADLCRCSACDQVAALGLQGLRDSHSALPVLAPLRCVREAWSSTPRHCPARGLCSAHRAHDCDMTHT
ncbi:hypothetical protein DFH06DRAFT_1212180 [Mycena polygramma]|nr:hypothetical protein DFH06DRAFT_1212180 [Mycena polygramma]